MTSLEPRWIIGGEYFPSSDCPNGFVSSLDLYHYSNALIVTIEWSFTVCEKLSLLHSSNVRRVIQIMCWIGKVHRSVQWCIDSTERNERSLA